MPSIPLPEPGEGGPVPEGGQTPTIPLPDPGEGGPVYPGGWLPGLIRPRRAMVRVLNAAFGYPALRILVERRPRTELLSYGALSGYGYVNGGYRTVTAVGPEGYIYLRKSLPFRPDGRYTAAVVNRPGGLDLVQLSDQCCGPEGGWAGLRLCNLAYRSSPVDMLLADGRTVYTDVGFKQTTPFKRIRPGRYEFFFADTDQEPMPDNGDVETLDSGFLGMQPLPGGTASLCLNVKSGVSYTVFLLCGGAPGGILALAAED